MANYMPGHTYRHTLLRPAMWTEIIIVNNQQQEVDVPVPNDPNVGIPYHRFIPNASSIDPICEALFSDRWALNVTNNPDGAAQNPWLTVGGKVYVAGNGQAQLNNGPTFDQNAPNLYVGGKVGIGDRDLFDASQHFAQDDQPRLLVEGDARIQPSKNQNGSLKANFHVVGTTAIEDPEDPSKSNPQFANPLMNIRGSLKIADPGQTPNFQPGNPLVTISGPTVIEKIGPNVKTTLDATALTNLDPQFRVFGNTILEGTTTVIGPLVINGSARVTEDLTVEKTTITKGLRPPGTDTTPTGYIRVNEGNLIVDPNVPTGPTGPAGAAGPTGPTGPTGPRGPAGSAPPPDNDFEGIVTIDGPESRAPALAVDGYAQFSGMISAFGHTEPVMIRVGELNRREAIPSKSGPGKRRKRYGVELNWFDEFVRLELLAHNKYNRDAVLVWGNDIKSRFVLRFNCDDKPPMSHDGTKPYNNEFPDSTIRRPEPGLANAGSDLTTPNKAPAQPKENTKDHVRDIMTVHPTGLIEINGWIRARGYRQYSDMQMKEDIQPISGALDKIQALRGVRYLWAEEESNARDGEDGPHLGFIAQEVEEVLPELVTSDQEQGKCVDYLQMTPLLIEAVKEQQAVIDAQKKQIDALEQKIQAIMSLLSAQKTDS